MGDIVNERTARDLRSEVTEQMRDSIERGENPEDAVRETVAAARSKPAGPIVGGWRRYPEFL
jgi:hypothetical protein